MIPKTDLICQTSDWKKILAGCVTDPVELLRRLGLSAADVDSGLDADQLFPVRVPEPFITRMEYGRADDPLLLQVLPRGAEFDQPPGFVADPLAEQDTPLPGLLHKYRNRVLFMASTACAVNCRYCFRRHFPYDDNQLARKQWSRLFDYLRLHPDVNEVILSGGDPLAASDAYLIDLISRLSALPQLRRLRIHTRLPVVIPQRITGALLASLEASALQTVLVIHSNHANELDDDVGQAMARCQAAGIRLYNQSVLLRDINDQATILAALSERLFAIGVQPYYLHLLDRVTGAAHFDVPVPEARKIMAELLGLLPGFLMPALVQEIAGHASKTPVDLRLA